MLALSGMFFYSSDVVFSQNMCQFIGKLDLSLAHLIVEVQFVAIALVHIIIKLFWEI